MSLAARFPVAVLGATGVAGRRALAALGDQDLLDRGLVGR